MSKPPSQFADHASRLRRKELQKLRRASFMPQKWSLGLRSPSREFWVQLWGQLARAGGLFPVALCGVLLVFSPLTVFTTGVSARFKSQVVSILLLTPFLFVVGLLWTGFVGAVIVPALCLFFGASGERLSRDRVGRLAGSLVATAAVGPLTLAAVGSQGPTGGWLALLSIVLAVVMGQAYGSLAGVDDLRRRRRGRLPGTLLRFTIWRLMAAMIPLSVLLSVLRALDLVNGAAAVYLGVCTLLAAATWAPVAWLMNRSLDRRLRRRRAERVS